VTEVFIGLGSNLNSPVEQIKRARKAIAELDGVDECAFSSLYKSRPMGPQDQPDYINAVMAVEVRLSSLALLDQLQAIELAQGRLRKEARWGARSLDLDIILYGEVVIESERLTIPHYGMAERNFVLYPLQEISPLLFIPNLGALSALVEQCSDEGLLKLGSSPPL
jgi:2-amino-4-hydroxy-6-hydroxymethyldihydropteridine diphosphokinase